MSEKFTSEQNFNETTIKPELTEDEKVTELTAQHLYDLRELTGFVSGSDLHDLFREVMDGEPSPSDTQPVNLTKLEQTALGKKALELLNSPVYKVVSAMVIYTGERGDLGDNTPLVDLEKGTVKAQLLYDIRRLTGFIGGADLHDLFREVLDGEPSPSGFKDIAIEKLASSNLGKLVLTEINKPTWEAMDSIKDYAGE